MSIFEKLDAMASRTNDRTNAVPFRMYAKEENVANPNARRSPSTTRPPLLVGEGIFEYTSIEFGMELGVRKSYREANDLRNVSVGRQPVISIDRSFFGALGREPQQGDVIVILMDDALTPRPDYPPFEVLDAQRDGLARLVCRLVQLGPQA